MVNVVITHIKDFIIQTKIEQISLYLQYNSHFTNDDLL